MPSPYDAGKITEGNLRAIVAYLRSLPAITHTVPGPRPAQPARKQ